MCSPSEYANRRLSGAHAIVGSGNRPSDQSSFENRPPMKRVAPSSRATTFRCQVESERYLLLPQNAIWPPSGENMGLMSVGLGGREASRANVIGSLPSGSATTIAPAESKAIMPFLGTGT